MPAYRIPSNDLHGITRGLRALLHKHNVERAQRVRAGVVRAAITTKKYVARNLTPIAFKELVESLTVRFSSRDARAEVVAGAPHAEAVELGSRPHVPPLEPLIKWVKLRGMQGLSGKKRRKMRGATSHWHATRIATLIRSHERNGAIPIDAPEQIARAIQAAIAAAGTKPQRFMFKAIPFANDTLFEEVSKAVPDR